MKSMTGFGRGEFENNGQHWTAEVRCVNNRYLDLKIKLPHGYSALEERIRKKISKIHLRGRVDLLLLQVGHALDLQKVKVNLALAEDYRDAIRTMAKEFNLQDNLTAELLASYPDVMVREQGNKDVNTVWPVVEKVIEEALVNCDNMRLQEGKALASDLNTRLDLFAKTIDTIEKDIPRLVEQRQDTLQERLEKLLGNVKLDSARLVQEIAILADKTDVSEEIVRLRCHIQQFILFLIEVGAVGRKLDFLIQEFLREVNTLGAKINDAGLAHLVVGLKSELEKMREQVQNIE